MTSPVRVPRPTPRGVPLHPAARVRPDLHVVREPARRSRTGYFVALSVISVFAALFVAGVAHSLLVSGQAHLDDVNSRIRSERQLLEREQLLLAERQAPGRIADEAAARGMVAGGEPTWMSLDPAANAAVAHGTDTTTASSSPASPNPASPNPASDPSAPSDANGGELASAPADGSVVEP
ncbi:MAG: hypothetical protein JWM47_485 [Acidimicrobiales bacterium]|nr:hypothetical protein [Acidimicrobiales bacterium]